MNILDTRLATQLSVCTIPNIWSHPPRRMTATTMDRMRCEKCGHVRYGSRLDCFDDDDDDEVCVSMCARGQLLVVCDLHLTCRGLADCCFTLSVGIENFQTLVLGILHICHVGSIRSKEFRLVVEPGYLLGGAVLKMPAITHHPRENRVIYEMTIYHEVSHDTPVVEVMVIVDMEKGRVSKSSCIFWMLNNNSTLYNVFSFLLTTALMTDIKFY